MAEQIHIEETKIEIVSDTRTRWQRFKAWWESLFKNEYEVNVWFFAGAVKNEDGSATPLRRSKKVFVLKEITKKTDRHIVGQDVFGKPFEIKTVEPFDYYIRKVK